MAEAGRQDKAQGIRGLFRWWRGWRLWLLAVVVAYTLAGFLLAPWIIKKQLVSFGETRLQRPLTVERVRVNPYSLTLTLEGLRLDEADGAPIASLGELFVNFQASSLFRWAWTFKELRLGAPHVNFVRYQDGSTNLAGVAGTLEATAGPSAAAPEPSDGDGGPVRLILMQFLLADGSADVTDLSRETDFATHFGPIRLELFSLSTLPEKEAGNSFRVVTETGAEIVWSGNLQATPFRLRGHLEARGERPRLIWRYIRDQVGFEIADGKASLALDLDLDATDGPLSVRVDNIAYSLDNLLLRPKGVEQDVLRIPRVEITGGRLRIPEQTFHVEEARIEGARLNAIRGKTGAVDVVEMLKPVAPAAVGPSGDPGTTEQAGQESETADAVPGSADTASQSDPPAAMEPAEAPIPVAETAEVTAPSPATEQAASNASASGPSAEPAAAAGAGDESAPAAPSPASAPESPPGWRFTLANLVIDDFGAEFEDRSFSEPVRTGVSGLHLEVGDFSTEPGHRFQFDFGSDITTGGRLSAKGEVGLQPQDLKMTFDLASLNIDLLETIIADRINLRLLSGEVSVNGQLSHDAEETLRFSGASSIDELVTEDTILGERFVAWNRLSIPSIEFALDGGTLAMDTVEFDAPYGKLTIKPDGTTNIADVFAPRPGAGDASTPVPEPSPEAADSKPLQIRVGRIKIAEGSANFADMSLPLPFATAIHSMKGEIGNVSSTAGSHASVDIAGVVDESGSADIGGELDPFAPVDHLEMDVEFKNVHMPRLTPYSAKFAGREIESGKLSLDLSYRINDGQLDSTNSVVIDRIKLGKKVDSPEAVNLPLDLAIALLQDSDGQIDLELPVTGDLNNPEFHYGAVVWKAFAGILVKAVTAPFKLLGALIPGGGQGEQLEFIYFDPGSAALTEAETKELDVVAQAVAKRPQLVLKVPASYSATTDKQALQAQKLEARVDERLPNIEARDSVPPEQVALEEIYIETFSRTELDNLRAANTRATEESGGKPTLDEGAYVAALNRSLRENEIVESAELEALAAARGKAITDYLLTAAGVNPGQLSQAGVTTTEPSADGRIQLKFEVGSGGPGAPSAPADDLADNSRVGDAMPTSTG